MAEITLTAEVGRPTGTRAARRLRAEGRVPGVVYGHGTDPVPVAVAWRELRQALTTEAGLNALINLDIAGDSQLTIVKELQRDPIQQTVRHVDFILISRDEELVVEVPILLEGEADAVTANDGMVDHVLFHLTVRAKPGSIPNEFTVDISGLEIGDTVRVGDLRLPAGVSTEVDPDEAIAIAQVSAAAIEMEQLEELAAAEAAEAEAEAAAEAGEEAPAEGEEAPAEGEEGAGEAGGGDGADGSGGEGGAGDES